ncbi:MAG TPA: hypothetical protein VGM37_02895 [Armatimonadota bacterium]
MFGIYPYEDQETDEEYITLGYDNDAKYGNPPPPPPTPTLPRDWQFQR